MASCRGEGKDGSGQTLGTNMFVPVSLRDRKRFLFLFVSFVCLIKALSHELWFVFCCSK